MSPSTLRDAKRFFTSYFQFMPQTPGCVSNLKKNLLKKEEDWYNPSAKQAEYHSCMLFACKVSCRDCRADHLVVLLFFLLVQRLLQKVSPFPSCSPSFVLHSLQFKVSKTDWEKCQNTGVHCSTHCQQFNQHHLCDYHQRPWLCRAGGCLRSQA